MIRFNISCEKFLSNIYKIKRVRQWVRKIQIEPQVYDRIFYLNTHTHTHIYRFNSLWITREKNSSSRIEMGEEADSCNENAFLPIYIYIHTHTRQSGQLWKPITFLSPLVYPGIWYRWNLACRIRHVDRPLPWPFQGICLVPRVFIFYPPLSSKKPPNHCPRPSRENVRANIRVNE